MKRVLERYGVPFAAIIVIMIIGLTAAIGILSNQRFYLPKWVPILGSDFVDYTIDFSSAKAVVPGQGQTVAISGVTVGDISDVQLVNGRGRVTVKIRREYASRIHTDATAMLRPRTPLEDMIIQLDPGTKAAPLLKEGGNIPVAQTMTPVGFDELLSEFDGDTRQYLAILLQQSGKAFAGEGGRDFGRLLRGLEPATTNTAKVARALRDYDTSIARSVTNLRNVMRALSKDQDGLADLVSNSADAFEGVAKSDQQLARAVQASPEAFKETQNLLERAGTIAQQGGEAARRLERPSAKLDQGFKNLIDFMDRATPSLRDDLRPLARDAQAPLGKLQQPVADLAASASNIRTGTSTLTDLFDGLAYKPTKTKDLSALTLAGWLGHASMNLTSLQDSAGAVARGIFYNDCFLYTALNSLYSDSPVSRVSLDLLGIPNKKTVLPNGQTTAAACGVKE